MGCSADKLPSYVIRPSPIHGMGAFAYEPLKTNTELGEALVVVSNKDPITFKRTFLSKFINHQEKPNIILCPKGDKFVWITLKEINPADELITNYKDYEFLIRRLSDLAGKSIKVI